MATIKRACAMAAARLHRAWRQAKTTLSTGRTAVHGLAPDFWRNLAAELAGGRLWVDRAVVLVYAAATGLLVVGFALLAEAASHAFTSG